MKDKNGNMQQKETDVKLNKKRKIDSNPEESQESKSRSRLREMIEILQKNEILKGLTPEKFRRILEDFGPTYIKLGQIMSMHSDILPKEYCEELMRLHSEVTPMPFHEVIEVIEDSYGYSWRKVFSKIEENPLGSASIAQVHRAVLKTGEQVVVKVQRKGIYETMSRDIRLLQKAVRLVPPGTLRNLADLHAVLDELWRVTQDEMDFLREADNMEEFARRNKDVAFVKTPELYRKYTTRYVLVMEYIDGFAVDDKKALLGNGYDLDEVGSKLVDNFIRQVMVDGFFHADPHPGNVRVCEGKIVWIDMGMMGRLSEGDRRQIAKAIEGVATHDIGKIQNVVLSLGEFRGKPNLGQLYEDIAALMAKYSTMDMGEVDVAELMQDLMEVMKENRISMPHGLTMLARGLTHIEGVLADISPGINMTEIATARVKSEFLRNMDWKKELKSEGKRLYRAADKMLELPSQLSDILQGYLHGQTGINLDLRVTKDFAELLRHLVRNIVMGLWVTALLISSSIICTTDMSPKILGIPALGVLGYVFALVIVVYVTLKHFLSKK